MADDSTLREDAPLLPIRTLQVEIVQGPDRGVTAQPKQATLSIGTAEGNDLVLHDPTVSRYHLELSPAESGILVVDTGSTNGVFVGTTRIERAVVPAATRLRLGRTELVVKDGELRGVGIHPTAQLAGILGQSVGMRKLMAEISRAAQGDAAVLLCGESGSGKELVARALHDLGPRADRPFVTVDCGALPPTIIASELFGHERGAFTGADRQRIGLCETARGGTLFLDEIGELPGSLQSVLLGVLERKTFRRLGGSTTIPFQARIISATHRDLRAEVNAGTFRMDLYYRLAILQLRIPPLRERADDIPLLVEHFLKDCGCDEPIEHYLSAEALAELARHRWPGNVRELRNFIEAAVAMGTPPALDAPSAGTAGADDVVAATLDEPYKEARRRVLDDFELRYLGRLLERCAGNVSRAAREGRINRSHLNELLQRHGLRGKAH